MASLIHVTGPTHLYVRGRAASASWLYLGTAKVSPVVEADPSYLPVMNDLAGRSKPIQKIYDGESHAVTVTLTRFDYTVWRICRDAQSHSLTLADHGYDGRLERGNLAMGGGDFELILKYDFYGTAAATADLPQGRWYSSAVVGNYREDAIGTRSQEISARFDCDALYVPASREFWLYSETLPSLPTPS